MRLRFSYLVIFVFILHAFPVLAAGPSRYGEIPLTFEKNLGQADSRVKFLSRGPGYGVFFTDREAILRLNQPTPATVRMSFSGNTSTPRIEPVDPLPGKTHYLKGPGSDAWHSDLPTYGRVRYGGVYPGVDIVYYGNQRQLEYDVIVAPGAHPEIVRLRFDGVHGMTIDSNGDLVLKTSAGEIHQAKPAIFQEIDGKRVAIDGGYVVLGSRSVGFRVGDYDQESLWSSIPLWFTRPFTAVPASPIRAMQITVDAAGNAYITGQTNSAGSFHSERNSDQTIGHDGWVRDQAGSDGHNRFVLDILREAQQLTRDTVSPSMPVETLTSRATPHHRISPSSMVSKNPGGGQDAYVLKLNSTGSTIVFSTFLGGSSDDRGFGITTDVRQ